MRGAQQDPEPGQQSLQLRERGSSGVGWAPGACRLLNSGGRSRQLTDQTSAPVSPGRVSPPAPLPNLLKGPVLGCSSPRRGQGILTAQSDPGSTLKPWTGVPEDSRPTWAGPAHALLSSFALARVGGGGRAITPGLGERTPPRRLLWVLFVSEVSSDPICAERHQPEVSHWLCAHWCCNLDLLCHTGRASVPQSLKEMFYTHPQGRKGSQFHGIICLKIALQGG